TKSLNTSLNAFKPSVRCFKNSLVLLYIEPISCFKSFILDFRELFSSTSSLYSRIFVFYLLTRSLSLFLICFFFFRLFLYLLFLVSSTILLCSCIFVFVLCT